MAVRSVSDLRLLFEKGDKPTQQDFVDLIDSFLHVQAGNFPNPMPAVSGKNLLDIGDALPNPLPARDGSLLTGIAPSEYNVISGNPTPSYATATSFVLTGDFTASLPVGARLELTIAAAAFYTNVASAVFAAGTTTVTITDSMPGTALTGLKVAVIRPAAAGGAVNLRSLGTLLQTVTLAAPADNITFSGLDGDAHERYVIEGILLSDYSGGAIRPTLRFNGDAFGASYGTVGNRIDGALETQLIYSHSTSWNGIRLWDLDSNTKFGHYRIEVNAKTGAHRLVICVGTVNSEKTGAGVAIQSLQAAGNWTDSSANLTSISLHGLDTGGVARNFSAGSSLRLLVL